jgi:hypothetical protein
MTPPQNRSQTHEHPAGAIFPPLEGCSCVTCGARARRAYDPAGRGWGECGCGGVFYPVQPLVRQRAAPHEVEASGVERGSPVRQGACTQGGCAAIVNSAPALSPHLPVSIPRRPTRPTCTPKHAATPGARRPATPSHTSSTSETARRARRRSLNRSRGYRDPWRTCMRAGVRDRCA